LGYEVIWQEKVLQDLEAIDKKDAYRIVERVKTSLVQNPTGLGTPLKGIFKGLFRYRYGMYRVLYAVDIAEQKVIVLHVKHRKKAYR
jgi:mRNA interferase RelE/StbE